MRDKPTTRASAKRPLVAPDVFLSVLVDRSTREQLRKLCFDQSVEVGDALRAMLRRQVESGTFEDLLLDQEGYMPAVLFAQRRAERRETRRRAQFKRTQAPGGTPTRRRK